MYKRQEEAFRTVIEGMHEVSEIGTSQLYFSDYPVDVISKTGTPQTKSYPNSVFTACAPMQDPQITIAVIIENGWHGYTGAPVAKAIFDRYFGFDNPDEEENDTAEENSTSSETAVNSETAFNESSETSSSEGETFSAVTPDAQIDERKENE